MTVEELRKDMGERHELLNLLEETRRLKGDPAMNDAQIRSLRQGLENDAVLAKSLDEGSALPS